MRRNLFSTYRPVSEKAISVGQLFSAIDDYAPFVLEEIKQVRLFAANSTIYRMGEVATSVYVLLEGRARLIDPRCRGRIIRPGVLCGMVETLGDVQYMSDLQAVTPCICSVIQRSDLIEYLRVRPKVSLKLTRLISRHYQFLAGLLRN